MRLYNLTEGRPRLYLIDERAVLRTVMDVQGGVVTTFNREGVDYTQILWRESGSFNLTENINAQLALIGGGGSAGRIGQCGGGGGAGGAFTVTSPSLFPSGAWSVSIGAGGAAVPNPGSGNAGSESMVTDGGLYTFVAAGGGGGGASGTGSDGACGGGAGTNSSTSAGGIGSVGGNGGSSFGGTTTSERSSGGGGGMSGPGTDGVMNVAGNGGPGITLAFTDTPMDVCGGGGGVAISGAHGTASHGGTPGAAGSSMNAVNGGGSGSATGGLGSSGNGGDGLFVIVVRSDEVTVL